jgi:hypothetical protein
MTRAAELRALADDCERMVRIGMDAGDTCAFVLKNEAAERTHGPLPNDLMERAAALRAAAKEPAP